MSAEGGRLRLGIDIGGTFTDFVLLDVASGELTTEKVLSTPDDPARAVLEGLSRLLDGSAGPEERALEVVHGSTVATNAVLERDGARTALVTSEGFADLLAIGRQVRPELYDLFADPPDPLVPEALAFEAPERVDREGRALREPSGDEISELARRIAESGAESVAVCLLFSFLRPEHEERIGEALRAEGLDVSLSSEILPEIREYERASTTAVNAYVSPALDRYLDRLSRELPADSFRIMQSNGGSIGTAAAGRQGVRSILSGPAGGVLGAIHAARAVGHERVLTFDMGGTSTDVSLADGEPRVTTEAAVGGLPIGVPVIDLHTVGSGGGSIARADPGGALRVGPESAGADPGPACYGLGGRAPTVTDANLVLGRLPAAGLLEGELPLDPEAAHHALEALARKLGLEAGAGLDPVRRAALGVVRVADAHMERALRVISVERGHDPADFVLVSFGGAGGLHACSLARALGVERVLVPTAASTLSALGMLAADVVRDHSRTVMLPGAAGRDPLVRGLEPLADRGREELRKEGVPEERIAVSRSLDMRYRGQSYELRVPFGPDVLSRFHAAHAAAYGHSDPDADVEIVTLRARAVGSVESPALPRREPGSPDPSPALLDRRPVLVGDGAGEGTAREEELPLYRGESLHPGARLSGPSVVARRDTTIYVPRGAEGEVDPYGNLMLEVGP